MIKRCCYIAAAGSALFIFAGATRAESNPQDRQAKTEPTGPAVYIDRSQKPADEPLSLTQGQPADERRVEERTTEERTTIETTETVEASGYLGASEFFNVREANANVRKGQWELRIPVGWSTGGDRGGDSRWYSWRRNRSQGVLGGDDDFNLGPSIKYGVCDWAYVALEAYPINMGDGGNMGAGDVGLTLFTQFIKEQDMIPALAMTTRMRIPSGDGSEGVDGEIYGHVTKTICPKLRVHFQAWAITANGGRDGSEDNRRHFQWGFGPGFDYELDDCTLLLLNYTNRSSDQYGNRNINMLEAGVNREICEGHNLKVAVDVGLDGAGETPNFGAKVEYGITW